MGGEIRAKIAAQNERRGDDFPAHAADDRFDRARRAGAVFSGADKKRARQRVGAVEAAIINAVEKVLHSARHIAEVFGRPQNNRVGGQDRAGVGSQGGALPQLDAFDFRRPAGERAGQRARVGRRRVADEEQFFHGWRARYLANQRRLKMRRFLL